MLPDATKAVLQIVLEGQSVAKTIATKGPARVQSQSITPFTAQKRIVLDATGFLSLPAAVEAHSQTTTEGVSSSLPGIRGRIVDRVAESRAQEAHSESQRIAADDVIREVADALDKTVDNHVSILNRAIVFPELFRETAGHEDGPQIHFSTSSKGMQVVVTAGQGVPTHLPGAESGDRGPVVVYLNCVELGERLPEVLRILERAHRLLLSRGKAARSNSPPADSLLPTGTTLEAMHYREEWMIAILGGGA